MRFKVLTIFIFFSQILFSQTATAPSSGAGTELDPYLISNLNNLYWIASSSSNWNKFFKQTADIEASETSTWGGGGWTPIGDFTNNFIGSYDGDGFTINGLYILRAASSQDGLFGYIGEGALIKNLGLTNVNFHSQNNIGAFAGEIRFAEILNCYATGVIISDELNAGGIVGYSDGSLISFCNNSAEVSGLFGIAGGITGRKRRRTH